MGMESIKNTSKSEAQESNQMISDEEFETQFIEQTIEVGGNELRYVAIEPSETISDEYVVYVGGFSMGPGVYKQEIKGLAQSGRKVLFLNPLKGIEVAKTDLEKFEEFNLPDTIKNKTSEALMLLDHLAISRADFVGHSQGAIIATVVAASRDNIADNLVLLNPAGLYGEDTSPDMWARTAKGTMREQADFWSGKNNNDKAGRAESILGPVTMNTELTERAPYWRATKEIPGILATNILPVLKELQKRTGDEKTMVTLVTANEDLTFPPKKIEEHIGFGDSQDAVAVESVFKDVVDAYAMYISKDAMHNAPAYEEVGILEQILNSNLEKKVQS